MGNSDLSSQEQVIAGVHPGSGRGSEDQTWPWNLSSGSGSCGSVLTGAPHPLGSGLGLSRLSSQLV